MSDEGEGYLLAGQLSELERLQLQSRVWEPTGRQLLSQLDGGTGGWVLDVGCGVRAGSGSSASGSAPPDG